MTFMIVYLSPFYSDGMVWDNDEERRKLVINHPQRELFTLENFTIAFNDSRISDLGYVELIEMPNE